MPELSSVYPASASARTRWIRAQRGARLPVSAERAHASFIETEPALAASAAIAATETGVPGANATLTIATLILVGRECPWTCLECDLWRGTLAGPTPPGALVRQVESALATLPPTRAVKLYNAGSLFDPRAVPPADLAPLAALVSGFERVIVECHPRLIGDAVSAFRDRLGGKLEVAMGLETADDRTLALLNKGMRVQHYIDASRWLIARAIDVRTFILVRPPFVAEAQALPQAQRSIDLALDEGARVVALIPTRAGNGAIDALVVQGLHAPPSLATLEAALEYGLMRKDGIVLADLWDIERHNGREPDFAARRDRLVQMNQAQRLSPVGSE